MKHILFRSRLKILFNLILICSGFSFAQTTTSTPWDEGFETTAIPAGWTRNTFVINTTQRLPGAQTNVIYRNFISGNPVTTDYFSTVSVGEIDNGDVLSFKYRFANFASPYGPPVAGAGNFVLAVSTDYGLNYQNVQTVSSNGTAGWLDFQIDLSDFEGEFVKIKITGNWVSGSWVLGFDDFHIGSAITCEQPYNLNLDFAGAEDAQVSWENSGSVENFNWYLFNPGADPQTDSPLFSGNSEDMFVHLNNLESNTNYDFYVRSNCGTEDGLSQFSQVLNFTTLCESITDFPFEEGFEAGSSGLDCWMNEQVTGNIDWNIATGAAGGSVNAAHSGSRNVIYFYDSPSQTRTRLISPSFDLTALSQPALSFWYANQNWNGQNELRVYYKTSSASEWVLIPGAVYTTNIQQWTEVEIELPESGEEYYLAFEGKNNWGYGIVLDDISVYDANGCTDTTTWNGIAWSNGEPDAGKTAVVDGYLHTAQDYESCSLEITENGYLYIGDGFDFTVRKSVVNNHSPSDFIVGNDANLLQIENGAVNSGEISVIRDSRPFKRLDYTLWSSPVENQGIQSFSPQTLPNRIYTYEGENGYVAVPDVNADFQTAKGYLFRAPNNWNAETAASYSGLFTGIPNNGTLEIPAHPGNYTSVGNPYPSNIDADELFNANAGLSALYFWTNTNPAVDGVYTGNNYSVYTYAGGVGTIGPEGNESQVPNGIISTAQGFIAATTGENLVFDNSMRTTDNTEFIRASMIERHRLWLNFSQGEANFNQIMVGYMEGATNGHDNQIDALMFGYSGPSLYSRIDGSENKYVIQGRALPFDVYDVVQLGVYIVNAGNYQISIANSDGLFSEGQQVYLLDKYLGQIHNLSDSLYGFYSEAGEFSDRFDIIYIDDSSTCSETTIWNGYTWNNGLPDENKKAVINGDFNLDSDLEVCEFEVAPNGKFTLAANANLTVNGIIINNSNLNEEGFIVQNNANLLQNETYTEENQGSIKVLRNSQNMVRLDYSFWSSPVLNQNLFEFSPETLTNRIYVYNGGSGYQNPNPLDENSIFKNGIGYLFRAPNNWNLTIPEIYPGEFTGEPFNGNLTVPAFSGNYTSIGNPYPSNIDAVLFLQENQQVGSIYFWVNTELIDGEYVGNNYATYNLAGGVSNTGITTPGETGVPTGIISVGQGFIVSNNDSNVHFKNEMRTSEPTGFFRPNELEKHRFWLNLKDENNQGLTQILIGYIENATNEFDQQMDAVQFGYEGSSIYSLLDDSKLTIQGKALPFEDSDIVPLGFYALESGKYTISLAEFDGLFAEGQNIYLKDKFLNFTQNLNESEYQFESEPGSFDDRFEIIYAEELMNIDENMKSDVVIYKNEDKIEIQSKESPVTEIKIYDLSGRMLLHIENLNHQFYQLNSKSFGKQILIVSVKTSDGEITDKKTIN